MSEDVTREDVTQPSTTVVGHKNGHVYMNCSGCEGVPPHFTKWTPEEARKVARNLLEYADAAEGSSVSEDAIINAAHADLTDRLKAAGRETESIVTIVLFKSAAGERDYHIAQLIDSESPDGHDELFCESAGRLSMAAQEVAAKHTERYPRGHH